ncbi:VOC family protein [Paenibacillus hexagrammi]|uniref:VOC family protein n=1 Tax=Paenibacillus hexagrammi TaxID=2908839 RepID=A0ABY3SPX1_9BACL|nr:VOC family protein [Paenibacillus sp. YPD9-1]UJF35734.1 VOC family protein [Paenibacillus sp. YPD9-1]
MNINETGIILFCENHNVVLKFYSEKLGLHVRKTGENLSVLDFGSSYLMLEDYPTVIRFNVNNFEEAVSELKQRGVFVDVKKHDWGTIGVIIDPEGNRIELKD